MCQRMLPRWWAQAGVSPGVIRRRFSPPEEWGNWRCVVCSGIPRWWSWLWRPLRSRPWRPAPPRRCKEAITADPYRPGYVYLAWDRYSNQAPNFKQGSSQNSSKGPAYFSRSTDGGRTWSNKVALYAADNGQDSRFSTVDQVVLSRSTDGGSTWSAPVAGGLMIGDYEALTNVGNTFAAAFQVDNADLTNPTDIRLATFPG